MLIDKKNIHNNRLQVINQYTAGKEDGAKYDNRYDVTILVNGLPLIHIELKRRGVACLLYTSKIQTVLEYMINQGSQIAYFLGEEI